MYYICTRNYEIIGSWCNGNTTVFGAVIQGSSPCEPTKKNPTFFKWDFLFYNVLSRNSDTKKSRSEINQNGILY